MQKKISFGKVDGYHNGKKQCEVVLELNLKEDREGRPVFTVCGNVYNARHTDIIQGGQCIDTVWDEYKTQLSNWKLYKEIKNLWEKYHLNDTNAWCEHQNYGHGIQKDVKIHHLSYNDEYARISKIRELPPQYLEVTEQGLKNVPMALYEYSSYKVKNNEHITTKSNGWITYDEVYSPEGLIGKPCPICGAKYGHSWYYMPIEENDLKRIKELMGVQG